MSLNSPVPRRFAPAAELRATEAEPRVGTLTGVERGQQREQVAAAVRQGRRAIRTRRLHVAAVAGHDLADPDLQPGTVARIDVVEAPPIGIEHADLERRAVAELELVIAAAARGISGFGHLGEVVEPDLQHVIAREAALFEDGIRANFDALIARGDLLEAPSLDGFIDGSFLAEAMKQ